MKYKVLLPIALVGLLVLSVFVTMDNNTKKENKYVECLAQAREAASFEIYVDIFDTDAISCETEPSHFCIPFLPCEPSTIKLYSFLSHASKTQSTVEPHILIFSSTFNPYSFKNFSL